MLIVAQEGDIRDAHSEAGGGDRAFCNCCRHATNRIHHHKRKRLSHLVMIFPSVLSSNPYDDRLSYMHHFIKITESDKRDQICADHPVNVTIINDLLPFFHYLPNQSITLKIKQKIPACKLLRSAVIMY